MSKSEKSSFGTFWLVGVDLSIWHISLFFYKINFMCQIKYKLETILLVFLYSYPNYVRGFLN